MEKTIQDVRDVFEVLIEDVAAKICNDYCKYPMIIEGEGALEQICKECPIDRLTV